MIRTLRLLWQHQSSLILVNTTHPWTVPLSFYFIFVSHGKPHREGCCRARLPITTFILNHFFKPSCSNVFHFGGRIYSIILWIHQFLSWEENIPTQILSLDKNIMKHLAFRSRESYIQFLLMPNLRSQKWGAIESSFSFLHFLKIFPLLVFSWEIENCLLTHFSLSELNENSN